MPVLSIIACRMLEDELKYVLSKDRKLKQLILVENRDCFELLRKIKSENCMPRMSPPERVPVLLEGGQNSIFETVLKTLLVFPFFRKIQEKRKAKRKREVTVVVNMLRFGLHTDIDSLKAEVYRTIREMAPYSSGILIFYGTCGHALRNLEKDIKDLKFPVFFLKDENGEIVEDCISAALGGNEAYARAMLAFRGTGTIYLTPMWASNWDKLGKETGTSSEGFEKRYLKNSRYSKTAKINTSITSDPDFHKNVQKFARNFGMEIVELQGSPAVAMQSYLAAKKDLTEG